MDCILKKHKRLLASKNTIPILTLSPGEFLFSDGTFINESSSPSRTKVLEENAVIHFADVSPYSEVENGLLVTVSNDRIIGYPVSRSQDGSADIGLPTLLGEDMGPVTALSIGLNKKWIAVGTTKGGVLLLRLRLEWFRNNFKILGVHQKGSLEDYSVTHISFVPNRSNKDSSECILVLLTSENNLKLWRVGDALLICDFELSSQLGRYPLTSLTVQNHIIVIGNSQGTLFFHHLLSSSKSDFFTRVIGTVHLAETFQLEQEFFHRDLNQERNDTI
nr:uncharacterized protein LOC121128341 [Lepeophtheirus salmonis]